jgi:hypothetical protein
MAFSLAYASCARFNQNDYYSARSAYGLRVTVIFTLAGRIAHRNVNAPSRSAAFRLGVGPAQISYKTKSEQR